MKLRTLRKAGLLVALAAIGCGPSSPTSGSSEPGLSQTSLAAVQPGNTGRAVAQPKCLLIIAVDVSKSTQYTRSQALSTVFDLAMGLDAKRYDLRIYRFSSKTEEVYTGVPDDEDQFSIDLANALRPSDPTQGTNYPLMVETIAKVVAESTDGNVKIDVISDGGNDFQDAASIKRYRKAATQLDNDPKVSSITFWGVEPGTREQLRNLFADTGTKLHLLNSGQDLTEDQE
ncbi:MAG TPA: hypothetical protein VHE55_15245 [Fimbriimonadaceae bacterium]|nr:hypothetical protein [Fimbriimonadaceae bacterium]